ncbi:MAG: TauD/TfdA family dioxygenase [Gammaproteobacteria bacterium]|nr:TauD/TfdA family dioxygenase [Gammaproteobacteria bacterium]MBT5154291.1 TauD/TfdA family dioxygenase [Gammaproteobacteria bacterium]MBT5722503.1 TauD/TfdA family dioxygenase [Gammaproteobacteria bacterium]MBT6584068.1 TauD/TfdA family dioxygenase [Gammaproteobacteria bacterium]MBT6892860.1 TauD/TfdA family dioxygenase [Gammaproteobacteria bacterium]
MAVSINTLPGVGAEILGVDIAGGLASSELDTIKQTFSEHGLVFFRNQKITEADHIEFAEVFGDINVNRFFAANPEYPQIAMVSKEPDQLENIGGGWHTDHSYDQEPALGSILVARELPASGGDTWFASMYKAYESLSDGLKETLEGMSAVHSAKHVFGPKGEYETTGSGGGRIGNAGAAVEMEDPIHPVVISHPISGRKALYVNAGFTLRFDGWTDEESAPLLAYLYERAIAEENITRFKWENGSVAFWDNRATWHYAQNDYPGQRRVMHRITIEGCALQPAKH